MKPAILKILGERYFNKDETTWEQFVHRVCWLLPELEDDVLNFKFLMSSPTLMNGNNPYTNGTLSSCFTMKIEDSIEGIFEAIKEAALVTKAAGGIGYDFSDLRGSSENVKGISANSSGPLPFINVFNSTLDGIMQGGKRRGAGMAQLSVTHPHILEFIQVKSIPGKFERFNFSVRLTDQFYAQLENDPNSVWYVKEVTTNKEYPLLSSDGKEVTVKQLWDIIIDRAWSTAEPGIFNSDIAFRQCAVTNLDKHVLSNPCAEYISIPFGSCNLGSINLSQLVNEKRFDWSEFELLISKATRYLNSVIDANKFPIKKIKDITLKIRPVGLGYMGLAHALYKMGIPYNSKEGFTFVYDVTRYLTLRSMKESIELAKKDGSYPAFDYDTYMNANERFFTEDSFKNIDLLKMKQDLKKVGIRNSCTTSIAPTGTIAFITDSSSGIEPVFALTYMRKIEKENKTHEIVYISDPVFELFLKDNFTDEQSIDIQKSVAENNGSCQKAPYLSNEQKAVFVVAADISPMDHLEALAMAGINSSTSVSKTINLPKEATREDIAEVYLAAHKKKIIGATVYRDGSREGILVHSVDDRPTDIVYHNSPKRPKEVTCDVHRVMYKGEKWIAFVGIFKDKPFEIFCGKVEDVNLSKHIDKGSVVKISGGHYSFVHDGEVLIKDIAKTFANLDHDAFARTISQELRHGIPLAHICDNLNKSEGDITSFSKVLSRIIKPYIKNGTVASGKCEKCGSKIIYIDGCKQCENPECKNSYCG